MVLSWFNDESETSLSLPATRVLLQHRGVRRRRLFRIDAIGPPVHPLRAAKLPAWPRTPRGWIVRPARAKRSERALDLHRIDPGTVVADVGAGSGYITVRLAKRVGPNGTVLANDIQSALLTAIRDKVRALQLTNVKTVQGTETDARLPEAGVDLGAALRRLPRIQKPTTDAPEHPPRAQA